MLVIAKQLGEYPQGVWRQPGNKFEFNGKKPAMWMMTEEDAGESKAKATADAEDAAEINKAVFEATAEVKAKIKARKAAEDAGKEKADDKPKEFRAIHRGAGKWDVWGLDGKVVKNGGDLNKADAAALAEKPFAE